jgi:chromosome segregation ATPase
VCPSFNKSFTSKIVFALDAYAEGSNIISSKMANLLVSILPSLQQSGAPIASALRHDTSSSKAALEAAKARLASAERWEHTASRSLKHAQNALMNAKTEYESAMKEADEARKYLASIDSSLQKDMNASSTNVAFDEDTPTITYDDAKPSMFVNDESTSTSIEEVVIKQRKFPFY